MSMIKFSKMPQDVVYGACDDGEDFIGIIRDFAKEYPFLCESTFSIFVAAECDGVVDTDWHKVPGVVLNQGLSDQELIALWPSVHDELKKVA